MLFNSDVATDSDNVWTDGPTVDAHVFQGWVYDYYFKRFGRHGMDDRDIEVDSIVHPLARSEANRQPPDVVGTYINNAFYCCEGLLVFGDGDGRLFNFLAGGFDVVAHEWTHGVTDFTSNLIYRDESGALNEAFSDIMAAAMEFYYYPAGTGRDQADWLIAEDVYLASPGYLRSLNNPSAKGHPDHYSLRRFIGTSTDDGGVHFNLTIATHAFYLAVAGGRNRVSGITVAGVGTRQHRAHGADLLPRIYAADGAQLAVLRRAPRHAAGGVRPLRRRQQRARTGRARLDRRGGELMLRSRESNVHQSKRRTSSWSVCWLCRRGDLPHRRRSASAFPSTAAQQTSTTTVTQEQTFDRYFEQGSFTFERTVPKAVIYDLGIAVRVWRGLHAGAAVSVFETRPAAAR